MAWGMLQLPGKPNEISVYATENYYEPSPGRVRRFSYRVDGFVALRAGSKGGQVLTRPLKYTGQKLSLNRIVRDGGELLIEILNQKGEVVGTSNPLTGDAIDAAVDWRQAPDMNQDFVRLRFTMKNADVYSLRFGVPPEN